MMAMMQQKGAMPGMMPMQGKGMPPMPGGPPTQPGAAGILTAASLASAPPAQQKQMLGQRLYPIVQKSHPELAGKITGMILEMDTSEILMLLESEPQLNVKISEA